MPYQSISDISEVMVPCETSTSNAGRHESAQKCEILPGLGGNWRGAVSDCDSLLFIGQELSVFLDRGNTGVRDLYKVGVSLKPLRLLACSENSRRFLRPRIQTALC